MMDGKQEKEEIFCFNFRSESWGVTLFKHLKTRQGQLNIAIVCPHQHSVTAICNRMPESESYRVSSWGVMKQFLYRT